MLEFVTAAIVLMYALAPPALGVIRITAPHLARPYRLRHAGLVAPVAFVVANLLLLWIGWQTLGKLLAVVGVGVIALVGLAATSPSYRHTAHEWRSAIWLVPYLAGMALLSYFGPFGSGSRSPTQEWIFLGICVTFSLAVYAIAIISGASASRRLAVGQRPVDLWYRYERLMKGESS